MSCDFLSTPSAGSRGEVADTLSDVTAQDAGEAASVNSEEERLTVCCVTQLGSGGGGRTRIQDSLALTQLTF